MAKLKYKNSSNEWKIISNIRGPEGPTGPKGDNAVIKLNGTNTTNASLYAPVTSGTEGQILKSHGGQAAPTWEDPTSSLENIDNLTQSTFSAEKVLSAHQGYVLNQNKVEKSTTIAGIDLQNSITITELVNAIKDEMMNAAHPVGSLYFSDDATNPSTLFGGTWERIQDVFILAAGSTYPINTTGGSASLQAHTHGVNITSGQNSAGHTHSIPSLSGTAASAGWHNHYIPNGSSPRNSGSPVKFESWPTAEGTARDHYTDGAGSHTHTVTTDAGTTGGVSGNHTHTVSGDTQSAGTGNAGNMPPYRTAYCWKRTA